MCLGSSGHCHRHCHPPRVLPQPTGPCCAWCAAGLMPPELNRTERSAKRPDRGLVASGAEAGVDFASPCWSRSVQVDWSRARDSAHSPTVLPRAGGRIVCRPGLGGERRPSAGGGRWPGGEGQVLGAGVGEDSLHSLVACSPSARPSRWQLHCLPRCHMSQASESAQNATA